MAGGGSAARCGLTAERLRTCGQLRTQMIRWDMSTAERLRASGDLPAGVLASNRPATE